ncbi:hypothetical protein XGA_0763 [Xanthomonas hortorum ATCC 19865]|nr:hypothetical protein XGA_0763 [Xanthomonas hortorum ATCC 19865]
MYRSYLQFLRAVRTHLATGPYALLLTLSVGVQSVAGTKPFDMMRNLLLMK